MSDKAMAEGVAAFAAGLPRTANPHDASSEDWMCWRDGYEQARAVAHRVDLPMPLAAGADRPSHD